jgi:hypothetical protein
MEDDGPIKMEEGEEYPSLVLEEDLEPDQTAAAETSINEVRIDK